MTYSDRTRQLDADLRSAGAPSDRHRRDRLLAAIGLALMAGGVLVALAGFAISATTSDPLRQSDGRSLGPIAITLAILGLALFLRFSATHFLRFWLARLIAERSAPRANEPAPPPAHPTTATSPVDASSTGLVSDSTER